VTNPTDLTSASSAQIQALTNEYKGHLFEYLVAQLLARRYGVEKDFLNHFGGEIKQRLVHYESWLRQVKPDIIQKLSQSATKLVGSEVLINLLAPYAINKVIVMGKSAQAAQFKSFEEADILLVDEKGRLIPLSLKLTHHGSALHTKSAGMKSFFVQYFSAFTESESLQQSFNDRCYEAYTAMSLDLLSMAGLEETSDVLRFSAIWKNAQLSELPGGLPEEMKARLHLCYFEMARALKQGLVILLESDSTLFEQSLLPLFGLGLPHMIQLTCFENNKGSVVIDFLTSAQCLKAMQNQLTLEPHALGQSSIYLRLDGLRLGLRIKPMNRFTQPGFKINCSYSKESNKAIG